MSQSVAQWLTEIKALQQQLAEAHQATEQAYASAANWQRLYETEAQQRRTETQLNRQVIEELKQTVQQLQGKLLAEPDEAELRSTIRLEIEQLIGEAELRQKLMDVMAERDRLVHALQTEQTNHAQTRKSLTTALGDAIDLLSKDTSFSG